MRIVTMVRTTLFLHLLPLALHFHLARSVLVAISRTLVLHTRGPHLKFLDTCSTRGHTMFSLLFDVNHLPCDAHVASLSVCVKCSRKSAVCGCSTGTHRDSLFLTLPLSHCRCSLYTETPRYTRTSGSTHDEGLPVLSPTPV